MSTRFPANFAAIYPNFTPNPDAAPLRALFMGTPQFAAPALDALHDNPAVAVVAVCTPPDRRRGRGQTLEPTPVKQRALELGLPVMQPPTLRNPDAVAELASYRPDIIVVAAYGQLLLPEILNLPPLGCLNLHPSLLPRQRGPSPVAGAILAGDAVTGVSIMRLDEGMDTGPVIARQERPIRPDDDAATLTAALFRDGAALLNAIIPQWAAGAIPAIPQDAAQATYTAKIARADGQADWTLPAIQLARMQRAYTPWPGLHTRWNGKELKLLAVDAIPGGGVPPGIVTAHNDGGIAIPIAIGTGDGLLAAHRLQLEGRRPADAADLLRGYPGLAGAVLG